VITQMIGKALKILIKLIAMATKSAGLIKGNLMCL